MTSRIKEIINHAGFRKYFTNTTWIFTEQLLRIITNLFVLVYIGRYLGLEKFGIFSYALVFVGLFGIISKLGLDSIVVRELVNYADKTDLYLGTAFWLKSAGGVLALGVIGIATQFIPNDITTNFYIFIIASGLLLQQFEVVDFYFQSKALSKFVSVFKIIQLAISCTLKLYLIFIQAGLFWFVVASLVDQLLLALSYIFVAWQQRIGLFFKYFKFGLAKEMLKNSWPLFFSAIASTVCMRIDQIMVKEMLGVKQVGLYSAAVGVSEAWYFVPGIIVGSLFSAILNAKKKSEELYLFRLTQLYNLMLRMALIVALFMTFFSRFVITLLYGQAFEGASGVLAVHAWTGVFLALGTVREKWLVSENLQIISLKTIFLVAVIDIILNYLLIPKYGIMGAAVATVIAYVLAVYIALFFYKKTREHFYLLTRILNPLRLFGLTKD